MSKTISIIGAGAWGTALAHLLGSKDLQVKLWVRENDVFLQIQNTGCNKTYLPGVNLPPTITPTLSIEEALSAANVIIGVIPTQFIRSVFGKAGTFIPKGSILVNASKGIEKKTLLTASGVFKELLGDRVQHAVLSGPSFAKEVSNKIPTAVSLAAENESEAGKLQKIFTTPYFRVYTNSDLMGAELGGALKNVIAIAAGISDGLGLGHSSRAALITRGLAEMTRIGVALGADQRTFSGLSGLGDLVLTCTGELSRNRTVGFKLGSGMKLKDILNGMKTVAEGVETSRSAYELSKKVGAETPIITEIYKVLYQRKSPASAVKHLMSRPPKSEFHG